MTYFFSKNEVFEKNLTKSAVHISPHNFDQKNHNRQIYGKYNAGVVVFKKNSEGKKFWIGGKIDVLKTVL